MVNVRRQHDQDSDWFARGPVGPGRSDRFNVLLTEDRGHGDEHWINQLPRLLEPMGVRTYVARSGREAIDMAEARRIHAAVVDLATPLADASRGPASAGDAGMWLLELLSRLPNRPPVVVLRQPAISFREAERMLREALRLGAFSVLDKPVGLEQLLAVFRRLLDQAYRGQWPEGRQRRSDEAT